MSSSLILFCGADARREDFDQRFSLGNQWLDLWRREKGDAVNQTQPTPHFANLFQTDSKFMNEILSRFRALQFTMIREWRGSTSQELIGNMPSGATRR
ncbi:MAG: hypothetical protein WAO00_08610 [Chthoniobacterales bacterium]